MLIQDCVYIVLIKAQLSGKLPYSMALHGDGSFYCLLLHLLTEELNIAT